MIKYLSHPCLNLPVKIFPADSKEFQEAYIAFKKAEIDLEQFAKTGHLHLTY